jgi:hypothetical protein
MSQIKNGKNSYKNKKSICFFVICDHKFGFCVHLFLIYDINRVLCVHLFLVYDINQVLCVHLFFVYDINPDFIDAFSEYVTVFTVFCDANHVICVTNPKSMITKMKFVTQITFHLRHKHEF